MLQIDGVASGPTAEFLAFVAQTPVAGWTGHVTQDAKTEGDGQLALKFDLPLRDLHGVKVNGQYRFVANAVRLPGVPALLATSGTLAFTDHDARATDVTADALGGSLKLQVTSEDGRVRVNGSGTADLQLVRARIRSAAARARERHDGLQLASTRTSSGSGGSSSRRSKARRSIFLRRCTRTLPTRSPLRVERREPRAGEDRIVVDYGPAARGACIARLARAADGRSGARAGGQGCDAKPADAEQPGLWIRGDRRTLDLDAWLALDARAGADASAQRRPARLALNGVDLTAGTLDALGPPLHEVADERAAPERRLAADARRQRARRHRRVARRDARAAERSHRRAPRRAWRRRRPATRREPAQRIAATRRDTLNRWPEVDIVADALRSKERTIGKLELLAHPRGSDWQIQQARAGQRRRPHRRRRLVAQRRRADRRRRLDVALDVKEAGAFLGRFGWPDAVKSAPTKIDGQLVVGRRAERLRLSDAVRQLQAASGAGQFTKVDPGVGRAARRAVAAGAAAAHLARFPRCVQRRLRVRHDHRRRADAERRDAHRRLPARRPGRRGRTSPATSTSRARRSS